MVRSFSQTKIAVSVSTDIVAQHLGYASSDFAIERIIASRADAITESGKIRP